MMINCRYRFLSLSLFLYRSLNNFAQKRVICTRSPIHLLHRQQQQHNNDKSKNKASSGAKMCSTKEKKTSCRKMLILS